MRCFYGSPSTYLWEDEMGITQYISHGRGVGRPLMPLLFALGQHRVLEAIHENMRPGEHVMAFLDDIHTACQPERLDEVHTTNNWPHTLTSTCTMARPKCGIEGVQPRDGGDDQGCESVET